MIDADQLRVSVVRPALHAIRYHSPASEALVMGTAAQESHLTYLKQLGTGPALGLFQMEPATYEDIWDNYLQYRAPLSDDILKAIAFRYSEPPEPVRMIWDLRFAAIMCRVHYLRVKEVLPAADDIHEQARYWKQYYNTHQGAGTEAEFVENYARIQ